jgi:DNA modification methylase
MKILQVPVADLSHDPANARKHPERNLDTIVASLRRFGQQKPIVIDRNNIVRAGNGTLEAAKRLGWEKIGCVRTELNGADATAYAIADNRTAELAEWDDEILAATLNGLALEEGLLEAAGYDEEELAAMLAEIDDAAVGEVTEDEVPEPPADPITKPGDLWILGRHRVLCGDSTKAEDVARLMGGIKADLCFTSPPYGQQRDYTKEGKEKCADWDGLMQGVFANLPMSDAGQVLVNLGLIHREGEWIPYWDGWIEWMRSQGWRRFGWYVWDQGFGMPGDWNGRLGPSFEFVFHFNKLTKRPDKWIKTKEASQTKGKQSAARMASGEFVPIQRSMNGNVKEVTGGQDTLGQKNKIPDSVIRIVRNQANDIARQNHPATFPVEFPAFGINCWPGDIYEPFCGSGTTLIAAEQLNRTCYGMEISPAYCDVIVKRWETLTGEKATCQRPTRD